MKLIVALALTPRSDAILRNQRGVALVLTLVAVMLFSMLGLFMSVNSQTESQIVNSEQSAKRALDISNAGISHAFRLIGDNSIDTAYQNGFDDELSNGGTGGALDATGTSVVTLEDGNQYRSFSFGGGTYYVRAVDNFDDDDQTTDSDQRIMIISRGQFPNTSGTAEKIIQAIALPATPCALTVEKDLSVSGNTDTNNVQVNTVDGFGACAHTNGDMRIRGNPTFPDGATSTGDMDCQGSANIKQGDCSSAEGSQPRRQLPSINVGELAQMVADLGSADPKGPYYILHTRAAGSFVIGDISKGRGYGGTNACPQSDASAATPATSTVGICTHGTLVFGSERYNLVGDSTGSYHEYPVMLDVYAANGKGNGDGSSSTSGTNTGGSGSGNEIANAYPVMLDVYAANGKGNGGGGSSTSGTNTGGSGNGNGSSNGGSSSGGGGGGPISISNGVCTFSGTIPDGIYYCDGKVVNSGQVDGANVTIIARDHIEFSSQINLETFYPIAPDPPASPNPLYDGGTSYTDRVDNLTESELKTAAIAARNKLSNIVLVAGADIRMTGNNNGVPGITGIILAHNEVDLQGGKTFTGYVQACNGLPTFTGDPWPESRLNEFVNANDVNGGITINFQNFGTAFPLGAPAMTAWQDRAQ